MMRSSMLNPQVWGALVVSILVGCASVLVAAGDFVPAADDWPCWRGPNHNGVAAANQNPPVEFGDTQNVRWKTPIPGRGHGSPIVVGPRVFLATAEETQEVQSLVCLDRDSGRLSWKTDVHQGHFVKGGNAKSSHASATPACDGERVFINFANNAAITTSALSVDGEILWQTKITDYVMHQGYGASPIVHGPLVIVMADNKGGGVLAGLDRESGKIVWRRERPKLPNYPSPTILKIDGREQLLMTGCDLVTSLDPLTGEKIWESAGSTTECVTSTVTDGRLIFTSGGYPKNHIAAVRADGSGKIEWENKMRLYVPSMLVREGKLYFVTDAGVAMCRDCATGEEVWNSRLGGTFDASPVLVGENIFAINEAGEAFVFKATPRGFEKVAQSKLGDQVFATPAICGSRIYARVATFAGDARQEVVYCLERQK